jgi:nucleotide-binding universal stress UspA family protein
MRMWRFIQPFQQSVESDCVELVYGEPGLVIPKFAKDHDVDLVIMGTLGRLSENGIFIGGNAERILNGLDCSVLAVKPSGFVSPIKIPS